MSPEKQYAVTYRFGDDAEPRVFECRVSATDPQHAEQFVRGLVWISANHDDWWACPDRNPHRLESLQFIEVKACA
jgi:hypothetical protein